jgi:hypothetical protein
VTRHGALAVGSVSASRRPLPTMTAPAAKIAEDYKDAKSVALGGKQGDSP